MHQDTPNLTNLDFVSCRGATCYLNSLFQALFMNPQFREAIYALPLCDGSLDQPTNFVKGGKRKMLLEI